VKKDLKRIACPLLEGTPKIHKIKKQGLALIVVAKPLLQSLIKGKNMSENISIEEFEKKVKEMLRKPFSITYESEKKDEKALSIYVNSALFIDVMQPTWQEVFSSCLEIIKTQLGVDK